MALRRKERSQDSHYSSGTISQCSSKAGKPAGNWSVIRKSESFDLKGIQVTESEGHERGRDGRYHVGGPFSTYRSRKTPGSAFYNSIIPRNEAFQRYQGDVLCPFPEVDPAFMPKQKDYSKQNWSSLDEQGATAIALVEPTRPTSNLAIALGELKKDGLPSLPGITLWRQRTELARAAGSEYLNYQFGWAPLVNDVLTVGKSARFSALICKQYQRDEGKNVSREFEFPIENTYVRSDTPSAGAIMTDSGSVGKNFRAGVGATLTREEVSSRREWFSGAFTYALPSRTDSFGKMLGYGSEADKLFGITITPDVLWELAPWSWAIDWFSNAGDVIHNVGAFGLAGLVMRYGYMMQETEHRVTNTLDHMNLIGSETRGMPSSEYVTTSKVRRPADPFGFGLTEFDLSPTQIAISAALGLTHLR
jgi:hypothetical protein